MGSEALYPEEICMCLHLGGRGGGELVEITGMLLHLRVLYIVVIPQLRLSCGEVD